MDWYRQKTWSKEIEDFFFTKLNRARKDSRAQYLTIQAIELVETQDLKLFNIAETLINKLFTEYPDDRFNRSSALVTLGDIYKLRNNLEKSINYYKQALDFEKVYPNVITQAYILYAELIIKTKKTNLYNFVESLILEKEPAFLFPIEKYKAYSILSIIHKYKGDLKQSEQFETLAEQNANKTTSGLRYHKHLGVVKDRNWLEKLLNRI